MNQVIREAAIKLGLTLRALAKLADMAPSDLSSMENDCLEVTAEEADRVGRALTVDLTFMCTPEYQAQARANCERRDRFFSDLGEARRRIVEEKKPHGEVVCPVCSGVLSYRVSSVNGHVWAQCETASCLCWME